jgi:lipopolysaccharide assembly protein A
MRVVTWAIWLVVFLLLIGFVAKNAEPVTLRFYFDLALQAPLIVVIFASFAVGSVFGILAIIPRLLRQRRELTRLARETRARAEPPPPPLAGL